MGPFSAICNIVNTLGESEDVVARCFRLGIYSNPIDSSIHASTARTWTSCIDYRTEPYFLGGDFFISWTVFAATNIRNGPELAVDVVAPRFWLEIYSNPIDC